MYTVTLQYIIDVGQSNPGSFLSNALAACSNENLSHAVLAKVLVLPMSGFIFATPRARKPDHGLTMSLF